MYKLINKSEMIIRTTDGANIPPDLGNRDYQEYLKWLAEGNTPELWRPWLEAGNMPEPAEGASA